MSPLFPEPEEIRAFPPGLPSELTALAIPIWQLDGRFRADERQHLHTWYPSFFTYEDAKLVITKVIDYQLPLVLSFITVLEHAGDGKWIYNDRERDSEHYLKDKSDGLVSARPEHEACLFYANKGLAFLDKLRREMDISPDKARFQLSFGDYAQDCELERKHNSPENHSRITCLGVFVFSQLILYMISHYLLRCVAPD